MKRCLQKALVNLVGEKKSKITEIQQLGVELVHLSYKRQDSIIAPNDNNRHVFDPRLGQGSLLMSCVFFHPAIVENCSSM
jgi:hypothetical protein